MKTNPNKSKTPNYALRSYFSFYRQFKLKTIITVLLFLMSVLADTTTPYFMGQLSGAAKYGTGKIGWLLLGLFLGSAAHEIFWIIGSYYRLKGLSLKENELNYIYANQILKSYTYADHIEKPSGKISSSLMGATEKSFSISDEIFDNYIKLIVGLPVLIFLSTALNPVNLLIYSLWAVVLVVALRYKLIPARKKSAIHADNKSGIYGRLYDRFANFVNIKSFKAESIESAAILKDNRSRIATGMAKWLADQSFWSVGASIIRFGMWGSIIGINYYMYAHGRIGLVALVTSITTLHSITEYLWTFIDSFKSFNTNISEYTQQYNYLFPDRDVVAEYYQNLKNPEPSRAINPSFKHQLALRNLTFAYPDRPSEVVLKGVNIKINKNEKVGIVGRSGSGKSTLVKILLGLYDVNPASILLDGLPTNPADLTPLYSYIPQDTSLFQETIAYNIKYGNTKKKITQKDIELAATRANAAEFIDTQAKKYQTVIGERGIKLSLGQRQRIAIARAFLRDSEILILDEATSALDSHTEKLVQNSLEELWKDKTVIAIAHRLSTLNNVDRIIVMDKGKVVEQGTKAELLAKQGHFFKLWQRQKDGLLRE